MKLTRDLLGASVTLKDSPAWQLVVESFRVQAALLTRRLVHGEALTEYQRATLAGRIQQIDELVDLAAKTAEDVQRFQTQ